MGGKRAAVLVGTALILFAVVVPLASANGPMPGTEQVEVTLPADGSAAATRAPMPANSTTGTVDVTDTSEDSSFLEEVFMALSAAPTRGARVVACVFMYSDLTGNADVPVDFTITEPSLQLIFLYGCLQLALTMGQQQSGAAHLGGAMAHEASAGCNPLAEAAPIHITKTASGYTATVSGTPSKAKKLRFRVSCTRTSKRLHVTVRPKSRRMKLAKAIGPTLGIGISSKSSSSAKVKIALGVH